MKKTFEVAMKNSKKTEKILNINKNDSKRKLTLSEKGKLSKKLDILMMSIVDIDLLTGADKSAQLGLKG